MLAQDELSEHLRVESRRNWSYKCVIRSN